MCQHYNLQRYMGMGTPHSYLLAVAVAPKPLLPSYIAAAMVTPFLPFYFMIMKTPGFTIYGV